MKPSSDERDVRLNEIFSKHNITNFWVGFKYLTQNDICGDLIAFEDCIIHFGANNLFVNVAIAKLYTKPNQCVLLVRYKTNDMHPKLTELVEFCKKNEIDWSDLDGASETVRVTFSHEIILKFVKAEYEKYSGCKLSSKPLAIINKKTGKQTHDEGGFCGESECDVETGEIRPCVAEEGEPDEVDPLWVIPDDMHTRRRRQEEAYRAEVVKRKAEILTRLLKRC